MGWYGLDRSGSGLGPVECSCEHGNETSGSIKCWEVLECLIRTRSCDLPACSIVPQSTTLPLQLPVVS
jgi:hypothetical protein